MKLRGTFALAAVFVYAPLQPAYAQIAANTSLADNQPVTLRGTLQMIHRGWVTYAVLKTDRAYATRFQPQSDAPPPVDQIQIVLDWQPLGAHAGTRVTVQGKVMINPYSGYYLNGVAVLADRVTLADGTVLAPGSAPKLPPNVSGYLATVVLDATAPDWTRSAFSLPYGRTLPSAPLDGCAPNAAGDLLNCGCIEGFAATRAGIVRAPLAANNLERLPRVEDGLAQLDLPDDTTHPLIVQVLCARQKATH